MLIVELADPRDPAPAALLAQAQALQAEIYPAEHNHALPTEALAQSDIRFFQARWGTEVLGVGAIKLHSDYAEVKSMFTAQSGRGKGVAAALLRALEDAARDEGKAALKLETGDELAAACRLYERHGFTRSTAFGAYEDNGVSVFMTKPL
ncbi:putative N-acetyltransferase YsnE [Aquimixticola soesokkakensis]|uniref:Putative N-acetyltransferase YsnE n=1 Tax=Aquimixticola soesokkakensis TaxID=1519096 RepID=A0A1Y5RHW1_9RHOB|nr:GNAT family N-acetyltransferase [Aquimixticola soesokkakensis]SLN16909.1 putative N-acetyltransferase YsnE [Aquimixticola soesokkakensis]